MKAKVVLSLILVALTLAACGSPTTAVPTVMPPTAVQPTNAPLPTTAAQTTAVAPATAAATTAPATGTTTRYVLVEGSNEARYRVREQLAGANLPNDAIGATKAITGVIVTDKDNKIVKDQSKITIDISKLKSDRSQRDNFLGNDTLQTRRFPNVTFVPTEATGLTFPLKEGDVQFKLNGDMTVRDVTKPTTWDVKLNIKGNEAKGQGTLTFNFAFFNLTQPRVASVLSIEDKIILEIDLHLKKE